MVQLRWMEERNNSIDEIDEYSTRMNGKNVIICMKSRNLQKQNAKMNAMQYSEGLHITMPSMFTSKTLHEAY